MPVGYGSLDSYARSMLRGMYPDIGQTFYVVDSTLRTIAQGWSKADRTGPLDLIEARRPGPGGVQYVFRTGDFASTAATIQAAHDGVVSSRGDAMFFCPGAYTLGAAVNVTSAGLRMLGRPIAHPAQSYTTITDAIGTGLSVTATATDLEIGFLKLVPLTATTTILAAGTCSGMYMHHVFWDATGVATSTSTVCLTISGAARNIWIDNPYWLTDVAQGPLVVVSGSAFALEISNFRHYHSSGTLAVGLIDVQAPGASGIRLSTGRGTIAGTTAAVTNLVKMTAMTNVISNGSINDFAGDVGYCAVGGLIGGARSTGNFTLVNCYLATVESAALTTVGSVPYIS